VQLIIFRVLHFKLDFGQPLAGTGGANSVSALGLGGLFGLSAVLAGALRKRAV